MDYLEQQDVELYGPFGGPREYSESMGRFNGGGWITSPMAGSDFDGHGFVMPAPPRDGEEDNPSVTPHMGAVGSAEFFNLYTGKGERWF